MSAAAIDDDAHYFCCVRSARRRDQPCVPVRSRMSGQVWFPSITEDLIVIRRMSAVGLTLVAVLGGVHLVGGSQNVAPKSEPKAEAPTIEPKADEYLKAMSSYLAGLKTYSFQVEEFFDEVQDDGQKIQLSNQRHMSVSRPNKVFGEDVGDTADSFFYYDGKTVSVYDRGSKDLRHGEGPRHHQRDAR